MNEERQRGSLGAAASRGVARTLASQAGRFILQFGATVILARLLSPSDFGLAAMVIAIAGIAEVFRDFGLSDAAIQSRSLSSEEQTNLFWLNVCIGVSCALLLIALSPLIAGFYQHPELIGISCGLAIGFVFNGAATQHLADINRDLRFGSLALIQVISQFAASMFAVASAFWGAGYWALVIQQVGLAAVTYALAASMSRWRPGLPNRRVSVRRFIRFGWQLAATRGMAYVSQNVDIITIGWAFGAAQLGLYSRARQLLTLPLNQINAPLTRVALPILSRVADDEIAFLSYARKAQLVSCYVTLAIFGFAAGGSVPLIELAFGREWRPAAILFSALCISGAFRSMAQVSFWIFLARGKTQAQLRMYAFTQPIIIISIIVGLVWGPLGVALAQGLSYAVFFGVSYWFAARASGLDLRPVVGVGIRSLFIVGVGSYAVTFLITQLMHESLLSLPTSLAAIGIYAAVVAACIPPIRADLRVLFTFARRSIRGTRTSAVA